MRVTTAPSLTGERLASAFQKNPGAVTAEQDGKYLHWDELRHRPLPTGLSAEEWWGLVKLARNSDRRALPVTDEAGHTFGFLMTDSVLRLLHEIDREASGRIELPEDITNEAVRDRYIVSSLIEESFRSSQLEGASTTRHVAKEMIRTKREPRTLSERMILNNFDAMEWVRTHRDDALTVPMMLELHRIVTHDTLEVPDGAGRFRRADEAIHVVDADSGDVLHTPPAATVLPARMEQLCGFANGGRNGGPFIHPVVRSILVHFWLAYDHPFIEGNGRLARALFYWSMLREGFWLTEFISISRAIKKSRGQYDRAFLYTETDQNDTTYFILNQLGVLRRAIDELGAYLKKKSQEIRDVERKLRGHDDLNNRQLAVVNHILRHPDTRITIDGHRSSHRVVYQTARTDLLGLVERGVLDQHKAGRKLYFTPAKDIQRKLR